MPKNLNKIHLNLQFAQTIVRKWDEGEWWKGGLSLRVVSDPNDQLRLMLKWLAYDVTRHHILPVLILILCIKVLK